MSTRVELYVIRGVSLDVKGFEEALNANEPLLEKMEELYFPWCGGEEAEGKLGVLFDGVNGDYAIAGYCVAAGNGKDDGHLSKPIEIRDREFNLDYKVAKWLTQNELSKYLKPDSDIATHVISHYH